MLVRDAMTAGALTVKKDDSVKSIVEKIIMRHCGSIPVVDDDDGLLGIVTIRDIMLPMYPNMGSTMARAAIHGSRTSCRRRVWSRRRRARANTERSVIVRLWKA